ncbi:MAG: flagellar hook capping FlgD N-terminal domain-containing protein [Pigmentiphaga sp.]
MISATDSTSQVLSGLGTTSKLMADTQDRFLELLVTQLRNQDPLNPMDNAELTSQIAQLSTVNGITQLNQTLLALSGQIDMSTAMQASALIDRDVLVPGDKISVGSGVTTPGGIDLVSPAAKVTAEIVDRSGKVLRSYDLGAQPAGILNVWWDGLDEAGAAAPDGAYYLRVAATDATGAAVAASTLTYARVAAVDYGNGGVKLDLGIFGKADLGDVRQVL